MLSPLPVTDVESSPPSTLIDRRRGWWLVAGLTLIVFVLACAIYVQVKNGVRTDFQTHSLNAHEAMTNLRWPPHFLYFAFLAVGSLVTSGSAAAFLRVSVVVLAGAIAMKYLIGARIVAHELQTRELPSAQPRAPSWPVLLGLFLLLFAHSLPRTPLYFSVAGMPWPREFSAYCFYAGRATSTLWHNSTSVFCMPIVLLLFHETSLLLAATPTIRPVRLAVWITLVVASKPSFLLAMVPVLPILAFWRHRFGRAFWASVGAVAFSGLLLALQRQWVAAHISAGYGVEFGFLRVWGPHAPVIWLDLLGSFAYPLLFAALFPRTALGDRVYVYGAAAAMAAVAIGMTVAESPPFTTTGNFMWQVHICCYVWFFATYVAQVRSLSVTGRALDWRDFVVFGCLGLHVVNGIVYLIRSFVIHTYM